MTKETMTVLWNGGWDKYEVDIDDQIDDDESQGIWPTIYPYHSEEGPCGPSYVRTCFSGDMNKRFPGKALRILVRLGGGD